MICLPVFHLELHLYEGFIARQDHQSLWQSGLQMFGLRSKGVEVSDAWQASARILLNNIFQKWTPSDKQSTERLCDNLIHFTQSLGSAHTRMSFKEDNSRPPMIKVGARRRSRIQSIYNIPPVTKCFFHRHPS